MKFEQKTGRSTQENAKSSESLRLWLASIAVGAAGVGGAVAAQEAVSEENEAPILMQYEDDSGDFVATDQSGELWVPITIKEGGTIDQMFSGDSKTIARIIEANGITGASDVRPEKPLWAPAEALERD